MTGKGMCKRCILREERSRTDREGKERKYGFCRKYDSPCQAVARNCPGYVNGNRLRFAGIKNAARYMNGSSLNEKEKIDE